ncbi:hypothetical protein ACOCJ4_09020 [Knoellia sp. CPCC 206435]|uniref:hypothetical protein n=1 Tax=Knoellia terrae TaxID=3404797 RepID=UPI003B435025
MRRLAALGLTGVLAACGSVSDVGDVPGPASTPGASTSTGPGPAPKPGPGTDTDCGKVVLAQGQRLEVVGSQERACLEEALRDGRGATLSVTEPTVEGDPIVTSWTLADDGTLTADIDSSQDRFGGEPRLTRVLCGRVSALPDPLRCDGSG